MEFKNILEIEFQFEKKLSKIKLSNDIEIWNWKTLNEIEFKFQKMIKPNRGPPLESTYSILKHNYGWSDVATLHGRWWRHEHRLWSQLMINHNSTHDHRSRWLSPLIFSW